MLTDALETPYQLLDPAGHLTGSLPTGVTDQKLLEWYRLMWLTRLFSNKIVALQRQGRATTWGPLIGQEASAVGMAAPLEDRDWITGSYREAGAYFTKGLSLATIAYYTRGYAAPPELSDGDKHCLPLQIVIGTQTLHAVGLAMAARIKGTGEVVVGGCGDGATSEGDFNEALNFAGVFKAPVVLVVINNGWAISTPRSRQSGAVRLARRGEGFGVPARLVDGKRHFGGLRGDAGGGRTSQGRRRANPGRNPDLPAGRTHYRRRPDPLPAQRRTGILASPRPDHALTPVAARPAVVERSRGCPTRRGGRSRSSQPDSKSARLRDARAGRSV